MQWLKSLRYKQEAGSLEERDEIPAEDIDESLQAFCYSFNPSILWVHTQELLCWVRWRAGSDASYSAPRSIFPLSFSLFIAASVLPFVQNSPLCSFLRAQRCPAAALPLHLTKSNIDGPYLTFIAVSAASLKFLQKRFGLVSLWNLMLDTLTWCRRVLVVQNKMKLQLHFHPIVMWIWSKRFFVTKISKCELDVLHLMV